MKEDWLELTVTSHGVQLLAEVRQPDERTGGR